MHNPEHNEIYQTGTPLNNPAKYAHLLKTEPKPPIIDPLYSNQYHKLAETTESETKKASNRTTTQTKQINCAYAGSRCLGHYMATDLIKSYTQIN